MCIKHECFQFTNLFDVVVITAFYMSGGISACNSHNFQVFLDWPTKFGLGAKTISAGLSKMNSVCAEKHCGSQKNVNMMIQNRLNPGKKVYILREWSSLRNLLPRNLLLVASTVFFLRTCLPKLISSINSPLSSIY